MSNFFNKSDLTRQDADKIVSDTLNNCDDGELYLEESKSESIVLQLFSVSDTILSASCLVKSDLLKKLLIHLK